MKKNVLIILSILCLVAQCQLDGTLTKVIMVFRHGARYPNYNAKEPIYNTDLTSKNSGQLSPVGARQLFQLGAQIRKDYIDGTTKFLSNKFSSREMYIRSTDSDRTIMSAQSFMAGLYPAGNDGPTIEDSILNDANKKKHLDPPFTPLVAQPGDNKSIQNGYQPVPIRTVQNQYDGALYIHGNACKNYAEWRNQNTEGPLFAEYRKYFDQTFKDFEKIFSKHKFDASKATLSTMYEWLDVLLCNQWNDFPTFDAESTAYYADQDLQKRMNALVHLQFYLSFFQTEQQKKVIPTPFFSDLLKYISKEHKSKFTVLSGHDTSINTVLQGLNLVNYECIIEYIKNNMSPVNGKVCITTETEFASNIIFEIREKDSKSYIMVKYNGVYQKICDQTKEYCELSEFQERIKNSIVTNYDEECGNIEEEDLEESQEAPGWTIAIMVVFGVLFGATLVAAVFFYKASRKAKEYMSAKPNQNTITV